MPETLHQSTNPPPQEVTAIKINFDKMTDEEFAGYEDAAIDGRLIYDDYPADEYKYFSRLSKLGYKNRHDGWSKEICEQKQREYKLEYLGAKEKTGRFFKTACRMQENIRRGEVLISKVYKARSSDDKLKYALQALELMTCEDGLAKRNGGERPGPAGCEYCSGTIEWKEKISADGDEVEFNFCPVCGRMIEEE